MYAINPQSTVSEEDGNAEITESERNRIKKYILTRPPSVADRISGHDK
jgi:hypothetical protein